MGCDKCPEVQLMRDLTSPRWIIFKGFLFVLTGLFAGILLIAEHPSFRIALLLGVCVWCFCRAYYFAFYVIHHYLYPSYRFSGLWSCARFLWSTRGGSRR